MSELPGLRARQLWLLLGWTLVLLVIYLLLTPAPVELPMEQGDKIAHVLAYATLMSWSANVYEASAQRMKFAVGFITLGVSLEFLQRWTGYRSFELADMIALRQRALPTPSLPHRSRNIPVERSARADERGASVWRATRLFQFRGTRSGAGSPMLRVARTSCI